MEPLCLFVEVPVCAFRPRWSRDYQDTYPFPPPATVYGMLLSLVGVDWQRKLDFAGIKLAVALEDGGEKSRVFRKFRRVPQAGKPDPLTSRRPDYQELLLGLRLWVWLSDGSSQTSLVGAVRQALDPRHRGKNQRFGGLSLGESSHLVNEISLKEPQGAGRFLCQDREGYYHLPVWVHHPRCGQGQTRLERFSLQPEAPLICPSADDPRWVLVSPS